MKCPLCGKEDIPKENRSKYDLLYECLNCILYCQSPPLKSGGLLLTKWLQ
jgi:uncharacterized Zn finger protein